MNIKIPHSWLLDYIKTSAKPQEVARALSLHAFSVEKMEKWPDGDTIYEIEITPNRGDALSVIGIAREVNACLPRLGIRSKWVGNTKPAGVGKGIVSAKQNLSLEVQIKDKSLVPQFSAIVLDNVSIQQSPEKIQGRLEKMGIRAINNVVDVTNYFMIDKGQPMHSFDYDKIGKTPKGGFHPSGGIPTMIVRESKAGPARHARQLAGVAGGESITTLDGVKRTLPKGVIVIEDGEGRLIDLCGIMGAQNSEVDENTKRVLLFVQIYDPVRIRKASMALGHRTDAAVRFEKGVDPEGVVPSLWEAVSMLEKYANAEVASKLVNIINNPYKQKRIIVNTDKIGKIAGVALTKKEIIDYLQSLHFQIENSRVKKPKAAIPSWRSDDIETDEDLAEEVVRLHGYYNLPNTPLAGEIPPRRTEKIFALEKKARNYLKYQGFFESYNTSATTKVMGGRGALELANPLSEELICLRTSLVPQLQEVIKHNKGYSDTLKLFELAAVYLPQEHNLPKQPLRLALVTKGLEYSKLKGTVEGLFEELGVGEGTDIKITNLGNNVLAVELDFESLAQRADDKKKFTPISKYAAVKQDLTLILPQNVSYYQVERVIKQADTRVERVRYKGSYQNSLTVGVTLLDRTAQLDAATASHIRQKILTDLKKTLKVGLKN